MKKLDTIFLVEDNTILAELIQHNLIKKLDCKVVLFQNADEVANYSEQEKPDVIILDYNYDELDLEIKNGLDFLIKLRDKSNVPVIALSGQKDKEVAVDIIRNGANDYINKDDTNFMLSLTESVETIFKIRETKRRLKKAISTLNAKFLFYSVALVVCVFVAVFAL